MFGFELNAAPPFFVWWPISLPCAGGALFKRPGVIARVEMLLAGARPRGHVGFGMFHRREFPMDGGETACVRECDADINACA